jgi:hypothetical protein
MPQKSSASDIGDAAVQAKTGKTWPQWFAVLEKAGAREMTHKDIVAVLAKKHGVGPWWQQMITVAYERHAGKRKRHEKPLGFEITRSRTLAAPVAEVFEAWGNARRRAAWLPGKPPAIRKATENRSLRMTWSDGTNVEVMLHSKGPKKTQVAVQHGRLGSAREGTKQKAYWGEALDRLAQLLEP